MFQLYPYWKARFLVDWQVSFLFLPPNEQNNLLQYIDPAYLFLDI